MKKFAIIHEYPKTQVLVTRFWDVDDEVDKLRIVCDIQDGEATMDIAADFNGESDIVDKYFDKLLDFDYVPVYLNTLLNNNPDYISEILGV